MKEVFPSIILFTARTLVSRRQAEGQSVGVLDLEELLEKLLDMKDPMRVLERRKLSEGAKSAFTEVLGEYRLYFPSKQPIPGCAPWSSTGLGE